MDYAGEAQRESERKEGPLEAYLMTKGILTHNAILERGEEPLDAEGNPFYVAMVPGVEAHVRACYGSEQDILAAIDAAHKATLEGE
jgi:hypothetical protein